MSGTTRFWFASALQRAALAVALSALGCGDDDGGGDDDPGDGSDVDAGAPDGGSSDAGGAPNIDRAQAGGSPSAIDIGDGLAFVGVGPRLSIWRAGGEDGPSLAAETEPFNGVVTGVLAVDDRVFVGEHREPDGRVHVLDVSDPAAPAETASFAIVEEGLSRPRGMTLVGQRLFIADQEQGVAEVDVTDPDAPVLVGIVPIPGVIDLEAVDTRLYYIVDSFVGTGVGALDLAGELADLGFVSLMGANGMAVTGQHMVVAAGGGGIQVQDLADLASPVERFRLELPDGGPFSRAVAVAGGQAWIPAEDGLYVLDLTPPTAITSGGPFPLPTQGANAAAATANGLAVVTDRGLVLAVDVGDPTQPVLRGAADVTLCSDCSGIAVVGELLAAADFTGGLRTARVEDLGLAGRSTEPAEMVVFEDVALGDGRAYVSDWAFGLRVYDLSEPNEPALVDLLDTPGFPSSVAVAGSRVYLGEGTNGGALRVIDVESDAREIGFVATSKARDVEVRGDLVFVADEELDMLGGLRIFDVSAPPDLPLVGSYQDLACTSALDVALTGSLAILACASGGFHIVDISDPATPTQLAVVPAPDIASAWSVAAWEGGAALGHDFGVIVVDLADPSAPAEVAAHDTPYTVRALAAPGDGRLVASCGLGGMYQWLVP